VNDDACVNQACQSGQCVGSCTPGQLRCAADGIEFCNSAGNWGLGFYCEHGCTFSGGAYSCCDNPCQPGVCGQFTACGKSVNCGDPCAGNDECIGNTCTCVPRECDGGFWGTRSDGCGGQISCECADPWIYQCQHGLCSDTPDGCF
jgi:hypothetical protein